MGWASLTIFMVQNAIGGMLVRYTKAFVEAEYSSEVGVLIQEKRSPISPTCHTPDFVFISTLYPSVLLMGGPNVHRKFAIVINSVSSTFRSDQYPLSI